MLSKHDRHLQMFVDADRKQQERCQTADARLCQGHHAEETWEDPKPPATADLPEAPAAPALGEEAPLTLAGTTGAAAASGGICPLAQAPGGIPVVCLAIEAAQLLAEQALDVLNWGRRRKWPSHCGAKRWVPRPWKREDHGPLAPLPTQVLQSGEASLCLKERLPWGSVWTSIPDPVPEETQSGHCLCDESYRVSGALGTGLAMPGRARGGGGKSTLGRGTGRGQGQDPWRCGRRENTATAREVTEWAPGPRGTLCPTVFTLKVRGCVHLVCCRERGAGCPSTANKPWQPG